MIGIIGAMAEEVQGLIQVMENVSVMEKASMTFHKGQLYKQEVVVVRSGIGKVNAAVCAQILIDEFAVETIINTGIAGSLDERIDIGDMVISTDAVHHDMDATIFGDPLGQVPRMDTLYFPADQGLAAKAKGVNEAVNPQIKTFLGRVASGDQFVSSKEKKAVIKESFGPLCVEMEGAAIAHVAYLNHCPYLIVRSISDKADDSATEDYEVFEKKAVANSTTFMRSLIERW
ncbi:adenosylhomocysteine nucleosidase [Lachnospiraceae bacterium PF1-21]|uniref:adenosylhomocysteine nucleosidase n=1 Tax=Ohessyouella blattaphilus TaxID=2949333 RepID=A0ABT1EH55_9FIRM|nr:5'-methylthioadenosine/adenosylhomocysteine nucleosidase [Ohessyouella blattaphilus]MCP1110035.1 5'-methylthioadenosine/adenosylhomocysteine nucleosidase [Ohessyouella blattaphilus]MCR8563429.1 5'-methylthioadenosine/adenosylhomocysteine nucleosidase [Ohessyouella blattaphilus]